MLVKAKISFAGAVNMIKGETRDIPDSIVGDVLNCGYVEVVNSDGNSEAVGSKPVRRKKSAEN